MAAGYGRNKWFGPGRGERQVHAWPCVRKIKNDLTSILTKLAAAPHRVAAEYGKLTGCLLLLLDAADRSEVADGRLWPAMRQAVAPAVGQGDQDQGRGGVKSIALCAGCAIIFVGQGGPGQCS